MCASQRKELPLSPKGLGTQHCYSCCIGSSCGLDSNPGSGTSICGGCSWKWKVTEQMHRLNYMLTYSQRDESLKTIKSNYFSHTGPGGGSGPHKLASSSKPSQALRDPRRERPIKNGVRIAMLLFLVYRSTSSFLQAPLPGHSSAGLKVRLQPLRFQPMKARISKTRMGSNDHE